MTDLTISHVAHQDDIMDTTTEGVNSSACQGDSADGNTDIKNRQKTKENEEVADGVID